MKPGEREAKEILEKKGIVFNRKKNIFYVEITGVIGTVNCIWYNVYNKRKKRRLK